MSFIRHLAASLGLIALISGWFFEIVPAWVAVLAGIALVIWGLNLDWKRKERVAEEKAQRKAAQRRGR